jgi:hypothetical protein
MVAAAEIKRRKDNPQHAAQLYWGLIGTYLVFFALLPIRHCAGLTGAVLAIIMARGCLIGLHAHRNPVGNA